MCKHNEVTCIFKVDRLQMIVVAKNLSLLQLFISRMPKMCAILQLVSAPYVGPCSLKKNQAESKQSLVHPLYCYYSLFRSLNLVVDQFLLSRD